MPSKQERIEGGLAGLLVGDALGVPYEFHSPEAIPPAHEIEFDPPCGFRRAQSGVPPATWSDDGAQAICLLDSLLARGGIDPDDDARRLVDWYEKGISFGCSMGTGAPSSGSRSSAASHMNSTSRSSRSHR